MSFFISSWHSLGLSSRACHCSNFCHFVVVIVNWCLTLIRSNFPVDFGKGLTVVWITVLIYRNYLNYFPFCLRRTLEAVVVTCVCVCENANIWVLINLFYFIPETICHVNISGNNEAGWAKKFGLEKGNRMAGKNQICSWFSDCLRLTKHSHLLKTPLRYLRYGTLWLVSYFRWEKLPVERYDHIL